MQKLKWWLGFVVGAAICGFGQIGWENATSSFNPNAASVPEMGSYGEQCLLKGLNARPGIPAWRQREIPQVPWHVFAYTSEQKYWYNRGLTAVEGDPDWPYGMPPVSFAERERFQKFADKQIDKLVKDKDCGYSEQNSAQSRRQREADIQRAAGY